MIELNTIPSRERIGPIIEKLDVFYKLEFGIKLSENAGSLEPQWITDEKGELSFRYRHRFHDTIYHNTHLSQQRNGKWVLKVEATPEYWIKLDPTEMKNYRTMLGRIDEQSLEGFGFEIKKPSSTKRNPKAYEYEVMLQKDLTVGLFEAAGTEDPVEVLWALAAQSRRVLLMGMVNAVPDDFSQLWDDNVLIRYRYVEVSGPMANNDSVTKQGTPETRLFTEVDVGLTKTGGWSPERPEMFEHACPWKGRYIEGVGSPLLTGSAILKARSSTLYEREICEKCNYELTCMSSNYSVVPNTMQIVTKLL